MPVRLDISRMTGDGWALRLRFDAALRGPCMRCLEEAAPSTAVDAREVHQPGGGEDLESPYVEGEELDLRQWAHDALALALPVQVLCRPDCAGLCPTCGADLNADPGHTHGPQIDPRWAKLGELELKSGSKGPAARSDAGDDLGRGARSPRDRPHSEETAQAARASPSRTRGRRARAAAGRRARRGWPTAAPRS